MMNRKGGKSRRAPLRILVIALSIQGITPDAHDLSSRKLFHILTLTSSPARANLAGEGAAKGRTQIDGHEDAPDGPASTIRARCKKTPGVLCLVVRNRSEPTRAGIRAARRGSCPRPTVAPTRRSSPPHPPRRTPAPTSIGGSTSSIRSAA